MEPAPSINRRTTRPWWEFAFATSIDPGRGLNFAGVASPLVSPGARGACPESIPPHSSRFDGFSDVQLHIVTRRQSAVRSACQRPRCSQQAASRFSGNRSGGRLIPGSVRRKSVRLAARNLTCRTGPFELMCAYGDKADSPPDGLRPSSAQRSISRGIAHGRPKAPNFAMYADRS